MAEREHTLDKDCWCNPEVVVVDDHRYVGHKQSVEVNVVMGAQLRAIVRSALIHVKNAVASASNIEDMSAVNVDGIILEELEKWPLSGEGEPNDSLPEWLFNRYAKYSGVMGWDDLADAERVYWQHEADAVRRAVGRGGYRRVDPHQILSPDLDSEITRRAHLQAGQIAQRHQALATRLQAYQDQGNTVVSIQQAYSIIAGTTTPEEYASSLQNRPGD